jgi:tetratricopeptide (TPR) repeat protein
MDQVVRRNLVELYKSSSQVDEALEQLLELANIHYLMADLEKTHQTYEEALALSRNSRAPRQWVIRILGKMADLEIQSLEFKSAVRIFEQIRSLQPQEIGPRATLIDLNFRLGQANQAMAELDQYLKILESSRQMDKAARFLDELLKDRPDSAALQKRMITFYLSHDQKKTAIEKLDGLAERLLGEGNKEASLAVIQAIIALNPPNALEYQRLYAQLKAAPAALP